MTLHRDLHSHLYGCIDSGMLWQIGRDRYKIHQNRLAWYENEYAQAFGRRPKSVDYWTKDNGYDLLRKDFEVTDKVSFAQFQACFNLIIALCPIGPDDLTVPKMIFEHFVATMPQTQIEFRSVIPDHLTDGEAYQYLHALYLLLRAYWNDYLNEPQFLIAISLPRTSATATVSYRRLRNFLARHPEANRYFAAVDFCFFEEDDPPHQKADFIKQIALDNGATNTHLSVLLHVGETFETVSLACSARRVLEAALMGIPRLGHATSLGIHPHCLKGMNVFQSPSETAYHEQWLRLHQHELKQFGYSPPKSWAQAYSRPSHFTYDDQFMEDTLTFQSALIKWMADLSNCVIECCPSSNLRLSPLSNLQQHPIGRFKKAGINVFFAADDPVIFASTINYEFKKCIDSGLIDGDYLPTLETTAEKFSSLHLLPD